MAGNAYAAPIHSSMHGTNPQVNGTEQVCAPNSDHSFPSMFVDALLRSIMHSCFDHVGIPAPYFFGIWNAWMIWCEHTNLEAKNPVCARFVMLATWPGQQRYTRPAQFGCSMSYSSCSLCLENPMLSAALAGFNWPSTFLLAPRRTGCFF